MINKKIASLGFAAIVGALSMVAINAKSVSANTDYTGEAFAECKENIPSNYSLQTKSIEGAREICFSGFAVLYSAKTKTPVFAIEKLNRQRIQEAKGEQRTNKFYEEARLPGSTRSRLDDYRGSGYDRGHNAPAGDMNTDEAMAQSFSLANMVPQVPSHNRKTWSKIEQDTRKYVSRANGDVYVFTGPYFSSNHKEIGDHVWVPDVMWKVVYDVSSKKTFVHWSENTEGVSVQRPISYQEFESRTGLHLITE